MIDQLFAFDDGQQLEIQITVVLRDHRDRRVRSHARTIQNRSTRTDDHALLIGARNRVATRLTFLTLELLNDPGQDFDRRQPKTRHHLLGFDLRRHRSAAMKEAARKARLRVSLTRLTVGSNVGAVWIRRFATLHEI